MIFIIAYVAYVGMGLVSFSLVEFSLYPLTFLYILIGLLFYFVGCQFVLPDKRKFYFVLTIVVTTFYSYQHYHFLGLIIPLVAVVSLLFLERAKGEWLFAGGCLLLVAELVIKGVPLFHVELRKDYADPMFILGYCFLFLGVTFLARTWERKYVLGLLAGGLVLLSLFTYRVYVMELVIVVVVPLYMLQKIRLTHIIGLGLPVIALVLFLGYRGVAYQQWQFNALQLFFFRPAFTFGVLNELVEKAGFWGITHGQIWLKFACGAAVGEYIFATESNLTATLMGPLILDGGMVELGLMGIIGAAVNTLYRKAVNDETKVQYYAVVLAFVLAGVDVSFVPSIFLLLVAGLYLVSEKGT